jgi:hypothetical protein
MMTDRPLRGPGRPPVYAGQVLAKVGVAMLPEQRERLHEYAAQRGTNLSAVVRDIISQWEGWSEVAPREEVLAL